MTGGLSRGRCFDKRCPRVLFIVSSTRRQAETEARATSAASGTSANRRRSQPELDDIVSHDKDMRRTSASFWRLPRSISLPEDGKVERQNQDIAAQETGVDLVSKLPRIVTIINYAPGERGAKDKLYSTALNLPRGTTFLLYAISMDRTDKHKPPRRGESPRSFLSFSPRPSSPLLSLSHKLTA
jgi:hypothetical protein